MKNTAHNHSCFGRHVFSLRADVSISFASRGKGPRDAKEVETSARRLLGGEDEIKQNFSSGIEKNPGSLIICTWVTLCYRGGVEKKAVFI